MNTAHKIAENKHRSLEIDTIARTIWGEARGHDDTGMIAVANVIANRLKISNDKGRHWWGDSAIQICQKPFQFACWNKDGDEFRNVLSVSAADPNFAKALGVASIALNGELTDNTAGATHFYDAYKTRGNVPYWVGRHKPCAVIGTMLFYRIAE